MHILFVKPPYQVAGYYGLGKRYIPTPLAEACLIAYLKQEGYAPAMVDCHAREIDWEQVPDMLLKENPDVVCYSASMAAFHDSYMRFSAIVKATLPHAKVVAGGAHIGIVAEEVLKDDDTIDFVVYGEGEVTLTELVRALEAKETDFRSINGLVYKENDRVIRTAERPIIKDMDTLPDPDLDVLIELENNHFSLFPPDWDKWTLLVTARGCPGTCTFCTARISQGPYRCYTAEKAFSLIRKVHDYGARTIWIDDLSFPVNRERTEKLLDLIIASDMELNLIALSTVSMIIRDKDIMHMYKKAGIQGILLGGESPLKKDLMKYNKTVNDLKIKESVDILREADILSWVFYIIGDEDHSREDILEIYNFADEVNSAVAVFGPATPFPGTTYFDQLKESGLIKVFDYTYYDMTYAVMDTKHLKMEEIQEVKDGLAMAYSSKPERIDEFLNSSNPFVRHWYERLGKYVEKVHIHGDKTQRIPSMGIKGS
ncbi:MAG: radical SAM protein [Chitinivibrionales bacterium]|nr:radical SAM protein [Chitinivibrionales bacterium]